MAALAASAVFAGLPATAVAQTPAEATTVTATGTASILVRRPAHPSDATIRVAVRAAQVQVGPAAVGDARQEAERLASALGLKLGALQSVTEQPAAPFVPFFPVNGVAGSFGPGRYCGTVRRAAFRRTSDGRRMPTGRVVSRHVCRIPPSIAMSVSVTFLAT